MIAHGFASAGRRIALRVFGVALALTATVGCATSPTSETGPPSSRGIYAHGAVAADHPVASAAGAEILEAGGNAVDAAVATSFCLSVVRPYSCGIGGGGFMIIAGPPGAAGEPGVRVGLDYRESAPMAVGPEYFAENDVDSRFGPHACGVPGTVAGLLHALEHYGTMDRATVMAPAIRAAREGFAADRSFVGATETLAKRIDEYPALRRRARYMWEYVARRGRLRIGSRVTNLQQARALELISERGASVFYEGPIADAIVAAMEPGGGVITSADLAAYTVREVEPLVGSFRDLEVLTMPPPSSGGIAILQILGLLDRLQAAGVLPPPSTGFRDPVYVHLLAEAMKHAFADRARWLGDAEYVDVPTDALLAPWYLDDRARAIRPDRVRAVGEYGTQDVAVVLPEDGGTSHVSVIDAEGMAVACTETINLVFGSAVGVPGFGFILNDEMDDFTTRVGEPNEFGLRQSERNLPEPGKRPLSSMSPTIALRDGRAVVVAGASGGPRIITATLQVLLNILHFEQEVEAAVAAARVHHQWMPMRLDLEETWTDAETADELRAIGHEIGTRDYTGVVQVIRRTERGLEAVSDPRKGGAPAGY